MRCHLHLFHAFECAATGCWMQKVILMCTMAHPRVAQCVRHINSWPAPAAVSPNTGRRMYPAPSQNHRIGEHGCYDPPPPGTRAREDFFPIGSILLRSAVCPHRSATASSSAAAPGKRHPRPQVSASRRRRSPHRTRPARRGVPAGATAHRGGQSPRDEDLVESHSPTTSHGSQIRTPEDHPTSRRDSC